MSREIKIFILDILSSINEIEIFTLDIKNLEAYSNDYKTKRAVERNLEIIGEAVKNIPDNFKNEYLEVEWKKISGLRDMLAHAYFNIEDEIV